MARPESKLTTLKARQDRYLAARARRGTLSGASRAARISPNTVYQWRETDQPGGYTAEEFLALEIAAKNTHTEMLEEEADRRGHDGVLKPVFQGGKLAGKVREYSDTLLIFRLKALAPEKYRERQEVTGAGGGPLIVQFVQPDGHTGGGQEAGGDSS